MCVCVCVCVCVYVCVCERARARADVCLGVAGDVIFLRSVDVTAFLGVWALFRQ